jgi:hypothetical protein
MKSSLKFIKRWKVFGRRAVLDYLKEIQRRPADMIRLSRNLRDILNEDKELLKKLVK